LTASPSIPNIGGPLPGKGGAFVWPNSFGGLSPKPASRVPQSASSLRRCGLVFWNQCFGHRPSGYRYRISAAERSAARASGRL